MKAKDIFDKLFLALLLGVCTFATNEISKMSQSISDLNIKVSLLLQDNSGQGEDIKDLKERVRRLELTKLER